MNTFCNQNVDFKEIQEPANIDFIEREQILESSTRISQHKMVQTRNQQSEEKAKIAQNIVTHSWIGHFAQFVVFIDVFVISIIRSNFLQENLLQCAL